MLEHQETMRLIQLAQNGDGDACETLVRENTPLLKSIVKRYLGKHVEYDDLFQIAGIGLVKAVMNFSTEYNVRFTTYAVPMILGEIKRHMRDDGYIKVSRSTKSLASAITKYVDEYSKENSIEPTVEQIAQKLEVDVNDIVFAMEAVRMPVSLYETVSDKDGKSSELIERIPAEQDKEMAENLVLRDMLLQLPERERKIIILRYFKDMTQSEIAKQLGVSQVQISRLENRIIDKLKKLYEIT